MPRVKGTKLPEHAQQAVTENGATLPDYTYEQVDRVLSTLILAGGKITATVEALCEAGEQVTADQVRYWRDQAFTRRYLRLRAELAPQLDDKLAEAALARAAEYDAAEERYVAEALAKVEEVSPDKLAQNALALARAKGENIEKARLLKDRPTEIREVRDVGEIIAQLERLGVLEGDPRSASIDGDAVELVE